jgi:hypothetical protein
VVPESPPPEELPEPLPDELPELLPEELPELLPDELELPSEEPPSPPLEEETVPQALMAACWHAAMSVELQDWQGIWLEPICQ